jgi:DNA-binding NarL/FixJ family response regulator
VVKDIGPADLLQAIRVVAAGEMLLSPSVTRRLIAQFTARASRPQTALADQVARLTEREREVLELVAMGLSNREIAEHLVVGEATVKTHVSRLLSKLDSRDRAQLVIFAYESGLVTPGQR